MIKLFINGPLAEVRRLIDGKDVVIDCVHHNQYQEAYVLNRRGELARIDVSYNAKFRVANIVAPQVTELSAELANLLAPLKGVPFQADPAESATVVSFGKPFLNDFHETANALCAEVGIAILRVVEQQWCLRYTFARGGEIAVYDVWYNGKDRFTKCAPLITACSPGTLISDVGILLTEGMRK